MKRSASAVMARPAFEKISYSPATIAAEIAGLISAAEIAHHYGDEASAAKYRTTADRFANEVNSLRLADRGRVFTASAMAAPPREIGGPRTG